jgi:small conductance mechanosensitive channel
MKLSARTVLLASTSLLVGLILAGVLLYYGLVAYHLLPVSYALLVRLALTAALGVAAILLVQRILVQFLQRHVGPRRGGLLFTTYRLAAYTLLVVALLVIAGVNSFALLAGGTFAGLVLGLAGQVALSNIIAGIVLLFVRPMSPGERVTVVSSSYGLLMPSYPPKFYSQDFLIPGYSGTVKELGLVYSSVVLDDGPEMRIPNSILIQAAVLSHDVDDRWVRVKFEVPSSIDPKAVLEGVAAALAHNSWVVRPDLTRVFVNQANPTTFVISVDAKCRGSLEDPPRSSILMDVMAVVRGLTPTLPPSTSDKK